MLFCSAGYYRGANWPEEMASLVLGPQSWLAVELGFQVCSFWLSAQSSVPCSLRQDRKCHDGAGGVGREGKPFFASYLAVGRDGTLGAHSNPGQGMQGLEVSLGVGQT